MSQVKHRQPASQKLAAKKARTFRSFLLMEQLAAREIGARIAQARRERGMTQDDFAEITTFSKRSLQDYEGGVTIPYKHLRELSRLLRRPEDWFLYGDTEPSAVTVDQAAALRSEVAELREMVAELLRRDS